MSIQQALEYLVEGTDIFYDRRIVRVIERLVARYPVGTRVRLNTGESGIVLKQTENSIRPVIGILDEEDRLTEKIYQLNKKQECIYSSGRKLETERGEDRKCTNF